MCVATVRCRRQRLAIRLYKHTDTRRYLNLDDAGHAYGFVPSDPARYQDDSAVGTGDTSTWLMRSYDWVSGSSMRSAFTGPSVPKTGRARADEGGVTGHGAAGPEVGNSASTCRSSSAGPQNSRASGSLSAALCSPRRVSDRCGRGGVSGRAGQGSLEPGEELDDIGCFEDPVALSSDVALAEHAGSFETVGGLAGAHLGPSDQLAALSTVMTGTPGRTSRRSSTARVGADPSELFAPSCVECVDPGRVGLGVVARSVCCGCERAKPCGCVGGAFRAVMGADTSIRQSDRRCSHSRRWRARG